MNRMKLDGITEISFSRTYVRQTKPESNNPKNQWNETNKIKRSGAVVCISGESIIKFAFIGHKMWIAQKVGGGGENVVQNGKVFAGRPTFFDHELLVFYLYMKQDIDLCSAAIEAAAAASQ